MTSKEALRKIDRLIVEKVFGLTVTDEQDGRRTKSYVKKEDCENEDQFYEVNDVLLTDYGWMNDQASIAYFSSRIEPAFYLVERLRDMDNCCIKINLDVPGDVWRVEIRGHEYGCEVKGMSDGRESLPLQICIAALMSVGVDKKELKEILKYIEE